jgi:cytochrome P450
MNGLHLSLLNRVRRRRESEGKKDCMMDSLLDQEEKLGINEHQLCLLGGICLEGGSDTSACVIIDFIQAMTKWNHVLKRAQQEIDSVVGEDRTPVWSDYARLPYTATIVKETQRWRPVLPLVIPHAAIEGR